jgi:hypothetical protein
VAGRVVMTLRGHRPVGGGSSARWDWRRAIADRAREVRAEHALGEVSVSSAFEVDVLFFLMPARAGDADVDNLVRLVLNTLFDSRDEQADRTLTATLFDAEDARIHRLLVEKRTVTHPHEEGIEVVVRWD